MVVHLAPSWAYQVEEAFLAGTQVGIQKVVAAFALGMAFQVVADVTCLEVAVQQ